MHSFPQHQNGARSAASIDFSAVNAAALSSLASLVQQWLPGGVFHGAEYRIGDLRGSAGESVAINVKTGKWCDFANPDLCGGDPVSLHAAIMGTGQKEAAEDLAAILGLAADAPVTAPQAGAPRKAEWQQIPVPSDAPAAQFRHYRYGDHAAAWIYRAVTGVPLGYVVRFNLADGAKEVLPFTYCECRAAGFDNLDRDGKGKGNQWRVGERAWRWLSFAKPRPLYGLELLPANATGNVIIVEGEKCADALRRMLAGLPFVVVSWPGGGKAVKLVDWAPLKGRKVVIWPDADEAGRAAGLAIAGLLENVAAGVRIAVAPEGKPEGWDCADAEAEAWTGTAALEWLRGAVREPKYFALAAQDGSVADERPTIRLEAGKLPEQVTLAEAHLINAGVEIYRRGTNLVRAIADEVDAAHGHRTKTATLSNVSQTYLRDLMCREITFEKFDARRAKHCKINAPSELAQTLLAREGEWKFPPVVGVITTPTLRHDGSILAMRGYDAQTRFLLLDPPELGAALEHCTRGDALAAVALLEDLLVDFPFVDAASKSVALSALITPVVRGAFTVAPMHAARAPTPGSGKSYLFDVASAIATGQRCPVMAAGRTEEETEKRLGASLLAGQPIISIDNVNGDLGGDALCQIIERPVVRIRVLGKSEQQQIEARSTVFATGNNLRLVGDMTRRVILCTLDAGMEQPELRRFTTDPVMTVMKDRGRYIAAALTVVRAYFNAGRPDPAPPLGSFEEWSSTVRSALIWLGREDPVQTMETARGEDPELQALAAFVSAWAEEIGVGETYALTAAELIDRATKRGQGWEDSYTPTDLGWRRPKLHEALDMVAANRGQPDAKVLGKWLRRSVGKIIGGLRIVARGDNYGHARKWSIECV